MNETWIALKELGENRMAAIGAIIIIFLVFVAFFAPFFAPHDPLEQNLEKRLLASNGEYPFGTDELGRCIFSRVLYGTRISLEIGVIVVGITALVGTILGGVSGYCGGIVDEIIMRAVDVVLAFPSIILALVIAGLLGPGLFNVILALAVTHWPAYTRLVRAMTLSVKEKEFVEAVRALRASSFYIMRRHILPNCINPVIVLATLGIAHTIIFAAALSFLGLGIQPPTPEWGAMLKAGIPYLRSAPFFNLFPRHHDNDYRACF
jgi:peptide/nickel transport system permease protein